jgi:hypothetical protein
MRRPETVRSLDARVVFLVGARARPAGLCRIVITSMSQTGHRDIEGGHGDHPQSTQNQPLQGESNFGDSSGPFFSIYSKAAEDEDNKMAERWKNDADGILIFVSQCFNIYRYLCA